MPSFFSLSRRLLVFCALTLLTGLFAAKASADFDEGDYYIVSKSTLKLLTARPGDGGVFRVVQTARTSGDAAQIWRLKKKGANYEIVSKKYGKFLDVKANSADDDAVIDLWERTGGDNQSWKFVLIGGYYQIIAQNSGKGLNVSRNSIADGAPVIQYAVNNADNNLWALYKADSGVRAPSMEALLRTSKSTFNNQSGTYCLSALPAAAFEAVRMNRAKPAEYQPAGLYIEKGESVVIAASGVTVQSDGLYATVGPTNAFFTYKPKNDPFIVALHDGANAFTAPRSGLLYFHYIKTGFQGASLPPIDLKVKGGAAIPFFVDGETSLSEWKEMLNRHPDAPFVQMVSDRAIITVSGKTYRPLADVTPGEIFVVLNKVLAADDALSGFDSSGPRHRPTPLRLHYIEDDLTSANDLAGVYMYAGDYFIGMTPDSVADLVRPDYLKRKWAIWHETGHTYQQRDWTWDAITESSVNLYSLTAQERFGLPNRLDEKEAGGTKRERGRAFLAKPNRNFEDDKQFSDDDRAWVRLVPLEQLREGLGEAFYRKLHKYYRENPLTYPDDGDDETKIQIFVVRASKIAQQDLTGFFSRWGIKISAKTQSAVRALRLPASGDLSLIGFKK